MAPSGSVKTTFEVVEPASIPRKTGPEALAISLYSTLASLWRARQASNSAWSLKRTSSVFLGTSDFEVLFSRL